MRWIYCNRIGFRFTLVINMLLKHFNASQNWHTWIYNCRISSLVKCNIESIDFPSLESRQLSGSLSLRFIPMSLSIQRKCPWSKKSLNQDRTLSRYSIWRRISIWMASWSLLCSAVVSLNERAEIQRFFLFFFSRKCSFLLLFQLDRISFLISWIWNNWRSVWPWIAPTLQGKKFSSTIKSTK